VLETRYIKFIGIESEDKKGKKQLKKEENVIITWVSATPLDNVVGIQQNMASPVESQKNCNLDMHENWRP
jgi:hypothetical protein